MQKLFSKITQPIVFVYEWLKVPLVASNAESNPKHKDLTGTLTKGLESLRDAKGAFIAAPTDDYRACWIRDQLYATLAYFYTGDTQKFKEGIGVTFDIFSKHRKKIEHVICNLPTEGYQYIHAKFYSETLEEITHEWGHHQLDAIGLFLFMVGFSYKNKIPVIRTKKDKEMLQLLVQYLTTVHYWEFPDHGMWEENIDLHASSIGAVVAGLTLIKDEELAIVPETLIIHGHNTLNWLLPHESPGRDTDMATLSLMWPYNVVTPEIRSIILGRVFNKLVQEHGLNRYWGDNYYMSDNGTSGEWTFGFFWLSIIESEQGNHRKAREWFEKGIQQMTPEGHIPELYQNGLPNIHTPLAWAHSMALIALKKLKQ